MIQINLLPKEEQIAEPRFRLGLPRARFWISVLIGLGVFLPLAGVVLMQRARLRTLRGDIQQAEVEMRRLKPQVERIQQLARETDELNLRLSVIQGLNRDRYLPVELMDRLAEEVPDYLWLTRVSEGALNQMTVEGMTFSNLMVAELMSSMEESELLEDVSLVVAERAKTGAGTDRLVLSFILTARIVP